MTDINQENIMYIYQTVQESDFIQAFHALDRGEQFSYHGLQALYSHLEELAQDTGEPLELDVIALCCEYTEYESALDAAEQQGMDDAHASTESEALEWLQDSTLVIEHDSGIIIQDF